MEHTEVITLADAIAIQPNAVVSRTLFKHSAGSLTLFAFDKGQELHEHTAPFDAAVQVLEGEVELRIQGEPVRLKAGELAVMPANIPHAVKAVESFRMLLTMIRV